MPAVVEDVEPPVDIILSERTVLYKSLVIMRCDYKL